MADFAKNVLLAAKYDPESDDPTNFWMSEKMVRFVCFFFEKKKKKRKELFSHLLV